MGWRTARCVFGETCPLVAGTAGLGLGVGAILVIFSYLLPWFSLGTTEAAAAVLLGTAAWVLWRRPASTLRWPRLHPFVLVLLIVMSLFVLVFALFEQSIGMVTDGDFCIHAANLGLILRGWFPLRSPFLGWPIYGHFGRDLLISASSWMAGLQWFTMEWIYTSVIQLLSFWLLFSWMRRASGLQEVGLLAAFFAFFAANLGQNVGLIDTVANNTPTAYLFLLLCSWAVLTSLDGQGWAAPVIAGLLMGADAFVYELDCGLMVLTLLLLLLVPVWQGPRKPRFKRALVILAVAAMVSCSGGGTFTDMAARTLGLRVSHDNVLRQRVALKFPKQKLFQISYQNLRPSRAFETRFRPWGVSWKASTADSFVWSRKILSVFWYPAWLLPLSLVFLVRRKAVPGVWFGVFASFGVLVPAGVGFGLWNGEAQRWLFGAAVGSAIAFGSVLGNWLGSTRGKARLWSALAVAFAVWMCLPAFRLGLHDLVSACEHPGRPLPIGRPGIAPGTGLVPQPFRLLNYQYKITPSIVRAAAWLRKHSSPRDRFLADDAREPLDARGAIIGLVGMFPAMIVPPPPVSTATSGYVQSPAAMSFWETGEARELDAKQVQWLLITHAHRPDFWRRLRSSGMFRRVYSDAGVEVWRRVREDEPRISPNR